MSGTNTVIAPINDSLDYGEDYVELENVPFYQLARRWKDDNLKFLLQSPLTSIFLLKLHFEKNFSEDWQRQAGEFLLKELAFYFKLSELRPTNEQWVDLIKSLPRGNEIFWQGWLRHQALILLDIDEELLKALYYEYGRHRKKGIFLTIDDLVNAYRELSKQGRFVLADYKKVVDYFSS